MCRNIEHETDAVAADDMEVVVLVEGSVAVAALRVDEYHHTACAAGQ